MKKALAMIALAAVCFSSTSYAFTPVKAASDTTKKVKVKKKGDKMKMKKKSSRYYKESVVSAFFLKQNRPPGYQGACFVLEFYTFANSGQL